MDIYGLKNFKRIRLVAAILIGVLVATLVCWASFIFIKTNDAESLNERSSYKHIGNGFIYGENVNTYYMLSNLNVKEDEDSTPLPMDVFMQLEGIEYSGNYIDGIEEEGEIYKKDECAISSNYAKKLGLKEGGKLFIHVRDGEDYTVTVKKILPAYYGYSEPGIYKNKGLLVIGYNPGAVDKGWYKVYSFADTDTALFGGGTDAPIHKSDILSSIRGNYYKAMIVSVCAIVLVLFLYEMPLVSQVAVDNYERKDAAVFYGLTGSKRKKLIYVTVYSLYKYAVTFAVSFILSLVMLIWGYKITLFAFVFNLLLYAVTAVLSIVLNYFTSRVA